MPTPKKKRLQNTMKTKIDVNFLKVAGHCARSDIFPSGTNLGLGWYLASHCLGPAGRGGGSGLWG